ncbi:hypothetical protein QAD02_005595 [Eretmocerus hayati]|uniref:Uncharacterized protein n=1 Tax=Eretmocerus hayati TaxID=131215 RepID=A0ACC2NSY5_9HYME|nr:hypothetical protein QAD02_005595 [Eretmocerus hayati]
MQTTFLNLLKCPPEDKSKAIRVLNLWQKNNVFPPEVIQPLFDLVNPNHPIHKEQCNVVFTLGYFYRHILGGSSGGEGCLQEAAGSPCGIGAGIGGSIRMPSFFNGVFGHKPSKGIVSNEGQFPNAEIEDQHKLLGPMCRLAQDLRPMLEVLTCKHADQLDLKHKVDISKLKVYYMEGDGG